MSSSGSENEWCAPFLSGSDNIPFGSNRDKAPFVPIPSTDDVKRVLKLANVTSSDLVVDLGCGDSRVLVSAINDFGARAWGIDCDRELIEASISKYRDLCEGVGETGDKRLELVVGDFLAADFDIPKNTTVIVVYLLIRVMKHLIPLMRRKLMGADSDVRVVVSYFFEIEGLEGDGITMREDVYSGGVSCYVYTYVVNDQD